MSAPARNTTRPFVPQSFTIVINTYNRANVLGAALESLRHLRHPNFEVVVVNGPSTDDTEAVMAAHADAIRIGRCPEANLSKSRNVGIAMARGDVVAFMDDDARPEPDWLDELARGYADPRVAGVGGFIRDHTGVSFQCKVTVCDRYGDGVVYDSVEAADIVHAPGCERYLAMTGTNSSFRRDRLLALGGFDEEYAYFLDETDVNVRAVDAGWDIAYRPDAEIHHKYAESHLRRPDKVAKRIYLPVRSKAYFCVKNAAPETDLADVFAHLDKHTRHLKNAKDWLKRNAVIDDDHHARLIADIDEGLRDGVRDAFAASQRALLSEATLAEHAAGAFKRFPTPRPAQDRLRVCFVSQDYPPARCGGIGVWTHALATAIAALGHEVSVVARAHGEHNTVDYEDGVWVHRIRPVWSPKRTGPALPDLPQGIKDHAYAVHDEVVRIHGRRGLDIVSAPIWDLEGMACHRAGVLPVVTSLHTTHQLALPHKPDWLANDDYRRNHVDKMIAGEAQLLREAPFILANSDAVMADIAADFPDLPVRERAVLVPHGMPDGAAGGPLDAPPTALRAPGEVRVLFVGRMETRKGADLLLAVAPALLAKHSAMTLHLVGDDALKDDGATTMRARFEASLDPALAERVVFHGFVDRDALPAHYAACDVFVAPSRYESFGLIFLEAMMFAKACVGPDVGGVREVIVDGETGLLAPPGDADSLLRALDALIADPARRAAMGGAGRARYSERFTLDAMRDGVIETFQRWVAAHASAAAERIA